MKVPAPLSIRAKLGALLAEVRAAVLANPQPDLAAEIKADHLRETVALAVLSANLAAFFWLLP